VTAHTEATQAESQGYLDLMNDTRKELHANTAGIEEILQSKPMKWPRNQGFAQVRTMDGTKQS
jgi:hypothetical protein